MPIDESLYKVQQIARSPLVICMLANDPLASHAELDIREIAPQLKVFRDPELDPSAHARLLELFKEAGVPLLLGSSARTPSDTQWMVKAGYGFALIDQLLPVEAGLVTRPIAGVTRTVDTAFVYKDRADHIALPYIERFFEDRWQNTPRKRHAGKVRPEQLKLLA